MQEQDLDHGAYEKPQTPLSSDDVESWLKNSLRSNQAVEVIVIQVAGKVFFAFPFFFSACSLQGRLTADYPMSRRHEATHVWAEGDARVRSRELAN
jgi:hypothetical protein